MKKSDKLENAVQRSLGTHDPNYPLSENALTVLNKRYFIRDEQGNVIENWEELCRRVATTIASDEKTKEEQTEWADKYFEMMYNLRFVPNTPTLVNAGRGNDSNYQACFVLPVDDHMKSILKTGTDAAMIHKSGGGTGFNFGHLRPKGSIVKTTSGVASGPVSFMEMYNNITDTIKQGGTRRGANMGILPVDHPDIQMFIDCKQDTSKITNFNISVAATDKFMKAVLDNESYDLVNPFTKKVVQQLNAKEVFDYICKNAHATGEPGFFFIDSANKTDAFSMSDPSRRIEATNPCGEVPLRNYESCTLGSINLSKYVNEQTESIDWDALKCDVHTAVRFLDSVVEINPYPLPEIEETNKQTRKIGLGVMGWADLLILLNIQYGSTASFRLAEKIMRFIRDESHKYSELLGALKGVCFASEVTGGKRRNWWTTIIAPTGSISIIANASSGIEPLFSVAYIRTCMDNTKMTVVNPMFEQALQLAGIALTNDLKEKLLTNMSVRNVTELPRHIRDLFVTTADATMEQHVGMQAAFQKHVDGAVSKTINLVESATVEDVKKAYLLAYELGCKGITIYRDNSRPGQVLSTKKEEKSEKPKIRRRPAITTGTTEKVNTTLGKLYLTINRAHADDEIPTEVFLSIGKSGADILAFSEALGRLVSLSLKYGIPVSQISKQLKGIKGEDFIIHQDKRYLSIPDLIGRRLESETILKENKDEKSEIAIIRCPECESRVAKSEGCFKCTSCDWSKC